MASYKSSTIRVDLVMNKSLIFRYIAYLEVSTEGSLTFLHPGHITVRPKNTNASIVLTIIFIGSLY